MEHTNNEVAIIERVVVEATEKQLRELNDLQLAYVGGGIGDTLM